MTVEPMTVGIGAILLAAVGYGELRMRVADAHRRLDATDAAQAERDRQQDNKLEHIKDAIADFRVSVESRCFPR